MTLHDRIWFESIREFRAYMARKGKPERDVVLDQLIRMGLIDKDESVMSSGPSQLFRYAALMAGRQQSTYFKLEHRVCCRWLRISTR